MGFRRTNSADTAASFRANYENRVSQVGPRSSKRATDAALFRSLVLEKVQYHVVRQTSEIRALMIDDYGAHCNRRLERVLLEFVDLGVIRRVGRLPGHPNDPTTGYQRVRGR